MLRLPRLTHICNKSWNGLFFSCAGQVLHAFVTQRNAWTVVWQAPQTMASDSLARSEFSFVSVVPPQAVSVIGFQALA
jgi:hypothetical protein